MKITINKALITCIITCIYVFVFQLQGFAQSQGPLNPGTETNNILGGSVSWANPGNSVASDNTYAVATDGVSNFLNVSNYGFSIPSNANITGIMVEVERKAAPVSSVASGTWATFTPAAYSSGTATANYGSTSYTYNLPVSSITNNRRLLVVTVGIELPDNVGPADPSITFGTVTYNGVAMTQIVVNSMSSATTSNNVAIYYLLDSGLPLLNGNQTLVVNKTINGEAAGGAVSPGEYVEIVGVNTYTNVDQTNPINPITGVTKTSATSPIVAPPINNVRNGDYIVAATMNNSSSAGGGSITQNAGYTANFAVSNNNTLGPASGALLEVQSNSLSGVTGTPSVTVSATAAAASRLVMDAISINASRVYDNSVMLLNVLGMQVGSNLAVGPSGSLPNAWPDTDTYQTYGGASNLWGTTWAPSDINSSNFGLSFQVGATKSIASVDQIRITVYYSIPTKLTLLSFTLTKTNESIVSSIFYNVDDDTKYQLTLEKAGNDFNFKAVDSIIIIGEIGKIQNYIITDNNPSNVTSYYRIRISEEHEGASIQYSSIQYIIIDTEKQLDVQTYPNPVVDYLIIESEQKIISIDILDVTGKTLPLTISSVDSNKYKIESIPFKGLCTLVVNTVSGITSKKVIVN